MALGEGLKEGSLMHSEDAARDLVSAEDFYAWAGRKREAHLEKCLRIEINMVLGTEVLKSPKKEKQNEDMGSSSDHQKQ